MKPEQLAEYRKAISRALAAIPQVSEYAGMNSLDAILDAYMTNNWSNVVNVSGKPFSKEQQEAAVMQAERALAPAYRAQEAFDEDQVVQALNNDVAGFQSFKEGEQDSFKENKDTLDQNAADSGVLFAGSRFQKLNDLRNTYEDREKAKRGDLQNKIQTTVRGYQYQYGNDAARKLNNLYRVPGQSTFNANVAGGKVTPNRGLSSLYDTNKFNFQGTAPVSQKAAVQTRAASLLTNQANKLTSTGYKNKL